MTAIRDALRAIIDTLDAEEMGEGPPASEHVAHWQKLHDDGTAALAALDAETPATPADRAAQAERMERLEEALREARLIERERIAAALDEEADLIPCAEDAMVTRSNARLVRANFSYEDAERLEVEKDAAAARALSQEGSEPS